MKNLKPIYLLALGAAIIALTHMRFGFGFLIFFESIPFLIFLERPQRVRSQALLFAFMLVGWTLGTAKIVTDPIPWFGVFGYSLPLAFFKYLPFLGLLLFRNSKYTEWLFPALMILGEWMQTTFTPFATWGAAAYTQVNNPVWLQIVAVGGIWILGYAIYFISYQVYLLISNGYDNRNALKIVLPILLLSLFGTMRLTCAENLGSENLTVAAIGTNSVIGGPELPTAKERELNRHLIYSRMETASQAGAKLIVWTEAATGLIPDEEAAFQEKVSLLSDSLNVTSVVCYVILESTDPFRYENKYVLIDSSGKIQSVYHKHRPVPGEPCTPGVEPHEVYNLSDSQIGGAICYDFDYPDLGRNIAKLGADVVTVPSSDWRGIDPIHTQMAALRAIEGGFSMIRSTRWGLSAAVDPYGRVRGQMSDFNADEKILIASIPKRGQATLYTTLGDWVVYLSLLFILVGLWEQGHPGFIRSRLSSERQD